MRLWLLRLSCLLFLLPFALCAQNAAQTPGTRDGEELRYVVLLSRHGVRSPTGKAAQYNAYSAGNWPEWPVQPGYLTPHGFRLIEQLGAYDRAELAGEGLLSAQGCADATKLTFYADSDERTRETGKALAQGLMPGCNVPVGGLDEGANDPLFHPATNAAAPEATALAKAAIAGRIGGDAANLTPAYAPQIAVLDRILAGCGKAPAGKAKRTSLFDIPASLTAGNGDHLAEMKGPLNTASTLSENLLLEYTEGMDGANVGWGCVHRSELEELMALHTAAVDFTQRTPQIAKAQAANLLRLVRLSLQQAAEGKPTDGAMGKPSDRALFLIGHDTNLENIAGTLNLTWIVDGRRDDTPPGSTLTFELWRRRSSGEYQVRLYFTAQTLDQMRASVPLTSGSAPDRVPLFVPGCSTTDMSCPLDLFLRLLPEAQR